MTEDTPRYLELAADVVSAFVSNNSVQSSELPSLLGDVHATLRKLAGTDAGAAPEPPMPAVPVDQSVFPDFIISLEDGAKYKSMKRHLRARNMTPDQYRAKWGLPADYPMVAPSYAKVRSDLARKIGLGRHRKTGRSKRRAA